MMERTRTRRPTQADVARRAGVSQALVSYVINDVPRPVPDVTRRRVMDAVRELGYVPHNAARALRLDRTMTLALVIPDITNPYYPAVARGVQDRAEAAGYQVITYNTDGIAEKERRALAWIREGRADGLVISAFHLDDVDFLGLLDVGIQVTAIVSVDSATPDVGIDRVVVDVVDAVRQVARHITARGYDPVVALAGPLDTRVGRTRLDAFVEAMAEASSSRPIIVETTDFTFDEGRRAMAEILAGSVRPRVVFAANDLLALGAMECCRAEGVVVPDEVALIGFDDIEAGRLVTPQLTTVAQPTRRIGETAASLLVDRLTERSDRPGQVVSVPLELLVRGTG